MFETDDFAYSTLTRLCPALRSRTPAQPLQVVTGQSPTSSSVSTASPPSTGSSIGQSWSTGPYPLPHRRASRDPLSQPQPIGTTLDSRNALTSSFQPPAGDDTSAIHQLRASTIDQVNLEPSTARPSASPTTVSGTFNSLSRVLCIFPSRFLCTIGLPPNI
jgi:hypothetical protein